MDHSVLTLAVPGIQLYVHPILRYYSRHRLPRRFYDHIASIPRIECRKSLLAHRSPVATFFQQLQLDCWAYVVSKSIQLAQALGSDTYVTALQCS